MSNSTSISNTIGNIKAEIEDGYFLGKSIVFWVFSTCPLWLLSSITGSIALADIASVWGSLIMLLCFFNVIGKSVEMVRFLRIGAIALSIVQNLSWVTASSIHKFSLNLSIEKTLSGAMMGGLTFSNYALAIFYVCVFSTVIAYLGSLKIVNEKEKIVCNSLLQLRDMPIINLRYILTVLTVIDIVLIFTGVIGQRSIIIEGNEEGQQSLWIVLYDSVMPAQIIFNSLLLYRLQKDESNFFNWIILVLSILFLSYVYFTKGRSAFVFSITAFGYWYYFFLGGKPKVIRLVIIILVLYPIISQILLFSNFIRGVNGFSDWQSRSAIELLPEAWERFSSSTSLLKEEEASTTSNLASRPLVTIPLALCIQYPEERKSFTLGEDIKNSFIWVIPSAIFPDKKSYPIQENLLYQHFRIGRDMEQDTADSIYLSSYTEFSWFGLIIYPSLLFLLWYGMTTLFTSWKLKGFISVINISMFFTLFILNIGEGSIMSWLVALRSFVFWMIIYRLFLYAKSSKKNKSMLR